MDVQVTAADFAVVFTGVPLGKDPQDEYESLLKELTDYYGVSKKDIAQIELSVDCADVLQVMP